MTEPGGKLFKIKNPILILLRIWIHTDLNVFVNWEAMQNAAMQEICPPRFGLQVSVNEDSCVFFFEKESQLSLAFNVDTGSKVNSIPTKDLLCEGKRQTLTV